MQNEVVLFKRKNRWALTAVSILVCALLTPLIGFSFVIPHLFTLLPLVLLFLLGYVGPVSAVVCTVLCLLSARFFLGVLGAGIVALLCIPYSICAVYLAEKNHEFWLSGGIAAAVVFAAACLVVSIVGAWAKTDAVSAIIRTVTEAVNTQTDLADWLISLFSQTGLIGSESGGTLAMGNLSAEERAAILQQIMALFDSLLRLQIPMQISTGSLAAGVLGQAILRKAILKLGHAVDYPALRTWRIPKGWGRILGGTFALLFVLARLMPQYTRGMYYVFSGIFEQVFALQGIAAVCWILEERKRKQITKVVVFIIGYFVLQTPAVILGIADQAFDFTKRRAKLGDAEEVNPFDPRRE